MLAQTNAIPQGGEIWTYQELLFNATTATVTLEFLDSSSATVGIDVALDNISITSPFPIIASHPADRSALLGGSVDFQTVAIGPQPITYQWFFNHTNLLFGEINSSLLLTNVTLSQSGTYSVLVSNPFAAVFSSNALLIVLVEGADNDSDGLPNELETQLGTNPLNPDTDGDGLTDYAELFSHGTNPLLADTDGDGMPDGWEVQNDLNPLVNDAGDDLDLDGASNLQEYQNRALGYRPDRADSLGDGRSDYEQLFGTQTNRFYYDRNDRLIGADYNRGSNGFAIAYVYDGNGNLLRQKNLARDANHNGLPDLWEFLHGLTNNASAYADSDGDGWSDYQEWQAGTNPRDAASRPGLLDNPGLSIASLTLPFTPSNFVVGVGQLDGSGPEEIVIGADGNPGTNVNFLMVLTQGPTNWSTQRVDVGPFGITSIAVGQLTNRPGAGIYVGLRGATNGSGRVMEFANSGGIWQSNVVALSTNQAAFVLGVRGQDLLMSLATTNAPDGSLSAASFTINWNLFLMDTNTSHRVLGSLLQRQTGSAGAVRLLDSGGIAVGTKRFSTYAANLVSYWKLDGNSQDDIGSNNGTATAITFSDANGRIKQGAGFNGSSSVIRTSTSLSFADLTFSAWIKTAFNPGQIVANENSGAGPYVARMFVGSHKLNLALVLTGTGSLTLLSGSTTIDDGNWHFVVATRSGGTYKIYVDGNLDAQTAGSTLPTTSVPIAIGAEKYGGSLYDVINGAIDEVGIWSRALSAPEISLLYGNGNGLAYDSAAVLPEPAVSRTNNWRGWNLAGGIIRPTTTNAYSICYSFGDDVDGDGKLGSADNFVTAEYLVTGTNASLLTLSPQPISSLTPAQSYGLACVNFLNPSNKVFFTGEPDGRVFAWTPTGSTNPLQRQLFSAQYAGQGWHAMTAVKAPDAGEALAGLLVHPGTPNTCDLIYWPPQSSLPQPLNFPQTAPLTRVLPSTNVLGGLARVPIRLWDAEGNASLPLLQFQPAGSSNWAEAAIAYVDMSPYSFSTRVATLPAGSDHILWWNAAAIFPPGTITNVLLRARAMDTTLLGDWSAPVPYQVVILNDADMDGLPDAWELAHFGNLSQAGTGDPDGDGFTNTQEYLADTDPMDGTSYLRITGLGFVPGGVRIDWRGGILATQYLQQRLTLGGSNEFWMDLFTNPPPTQPAFSYTNFLGTNFMEFYRIRVER